MIKIFLGIFYIYDRGGVRKKKGLGSVLNGIEGKRIGNKVATDLKNLGKYTTHGRSQLWMNG